MIRKNITRIASFFGLSLKGTSLYFAELSDSSIHGAYVGIDPLSASRGMSFEDCKLAFSLDGKGLKLHTTVYAENTPLEFKICFSPSWIFHLEGWGVDHCLSVRQHAESELAQLIFDFSGLSLTGAKGDVLMLLGEGMPCVLGVFLRQKNTLDMEKVLRTLYESLYKPKEEPTEISWLQELDLSQAKITMGSRDTAQKVEILKMAGTNLWTGTDQEINDRLELVEMGLKDTNPTVQIQALDTFTVGGRVIGGVDLVANFLSQSNRGLRNGVSEEAVDAAVFLLYEAYSFNKKVAVLEQGFGTADIGIIHKKTDGVLSPEQYEAMNSIVSTKPQVRWTLSHQKILRDALEGVIATPNPFIPQSAISNAQRGLKDYPLPVSLSVQ